MLKDAWQALSRKDKLSNLTACLQEIYDIEHGKHTLSGKPQQGRLTGIKKELEEFALNVVDWEK